MKKNKEVIIESDAEVAPELTVKEANRIAGAVARLHELEDSKIVTANSDAEKKGLQDFVVASFLKHAGTFLGAYFTVKGEYEVLINLAAVFLRRVDGIRDHMRLQEAAHRAALQAREHTPNEEAQALKASQQ